MCRSCRQLLGPVQPGQRVRAVPGAGTNVPLWILGSSLFGAQLAAQLGLPYAFASHFAPAALHSALRVYRERFQPSAQLQKSYAMVGCNVICAPTDEEAQHLFTSLQRVVIGLVTGSPGTARATGAHRAAAAACAAVGGCLPRLLVRRIARHGAGGTRGIRFGTRRR